MIKQLLEQPDHDLRLVAQKINALQQQLQEAQIIQQRLIGGKEALLMLQKEDAPKEIDTAAGVSVA
jgi:hypothetical protein